MKKVFSAGETYWCIVHSRTDLNRPGIMLIQFWTGEGFVGTSPQAHLHAKLYKTKAEAETDAAKVVLSDPGRFMDHIEVVEQVCPKDVWK